MNKRLISTILVLILVLSFMPATALGDEPSVMIGGTTLNSSSSTLSIDGGTAKFSLDGSDIVLTLENFRFSGTDGSGNAIHANENIKIVLSGTNIITASDATSGNSCGIRVDEGLKIAGSGSLTVTGGAATGENGKSYGIYVGNNIDVDDKDVTLTAMGGAATGTGGESYGIYTESAGIMVDRSTLIATGGTAAGKSYGVCANGGNITVYHNTITAMGGEVTGVNGESYGVYAKNWIIVQERGTLNSTGGKVTGEGGKSYGALAYTDNITVKSGGTLSGKGGKATDVDSESNGVFTYNKNIIVESGGTLNGTGDEAKGQSYGVRSTSGSISVSGTNAKLEGTGSTATDSYGVITTNGSAEGHVTVQYGGELKGTGGEASGKSAGISISGNITASGGSIIGKSGNLTGYGHSTGIYAYKNIDVGADGSVKGTGGDANDGGCKSFGVHSENGNISVSGTNAVLEGTGGKANGASGESHGVCAMNGTISVSGEKAKLEGTGGTTIAKGGTATDSKAFNGDFKIAKGVSYQWRLSGDPSEYTESTKTPYSMQDTHKYVEIIFWNGTQPTPTVSPSPTPTPTPASTPALAAAQGGLITYTHGDWVRDNQYDAMAPSSGLEPDKAAPAQDLFGTAGTAATPAPVTTPIPATTTTTPTDAATATIPPQTADGVTVVGFVMIIVGICALMVRRKRV